MVDMICKSAISENAWIQSLKKELRVACPSMHARADGNKVCITGKYPIRGEQGDIIDVYDLKIELDAERPDEMPIVFETGGKIPRDASRHVHPSGALCLFVPDERRRYWNGQTSIAQFLNGPIRQFFLSQLYFLEHQEWPFGERSHGIKGRLEYYLELLQTEDLLIVLRFLRFLSKPKILRPHECFCGSNRGLLWCHPATTLHRDQHVDAEELNKLIEYVSLRLKLNERTAPAGQGFSALSKVFAGSAQLGRLTRNEIKRMLRSSHE